MKFLHLSDLHLGKRVNDVPMLDDQRFILQQIEAIVADEKPDAVLIAGDVYDKSVPSAEAVELLDDFLCRLAAARQQVFVVSGNHDSPERLAFASRLIDASGIHLSRVYDGKVAPITLRDEFGPIHIYMMPFVKPALVRHCYPEEKIDNYTDAFRVAVAQMNVDWTERNVLVAHQFVTGPDGVSGIIHSDSEDISIGGLDNVDASVMADFDYVALGHIHGPQNVGGYSHIRYCGTPLKYSFSEISHKKSITRIVLGKKGSCEVTTIPLQPLHDMREIRGKYAELTDRRFYAGTQTEDYLRVVLTDEQDVLEALSRLRTVYPNIMQLEYDNERTRISRQPITAATAERQPVELFADFFKQCNGKDMSEEQTKIITELIQTIWEK